jgi:pimeloyl-ACP methyl ester carboxylesterase
VNGGSGADVPGTWSASLEWLVERLAPQFPELEFVEVRFRIKSWRRLDECAQDALAAIELSGAQRTALLGFSMGGAVAIKVAHHPSVEAIVGLAPWIPDRLELESLRGKRLAVVHGRLDRYLPGLPGVSAASARRGCKRALAAGATGDYTPIPGGLHGVAVRSLWGKPVPLPRARRWAQLVGEELRRFQATG